MVETKDTTQRKKYRKKLKNLFQKRRKKLTATQLAPLAEEKKGGKRKI